MLNFFKRRPAPTDKPAPAERARSRPAPRRDAPLASDPAPLPEVSEGNLESDWAMWEDSVAFQDSQMPSAFNELESVRDRNAPAKPRAPDAPDAFSSVRKRGD